MNILKSKIKGVFLVFVVSLLLISSSAFALIVDPVIEEEVVLYHLGIGEIRSSVGV